MMFEGKKLLIKQKGLFILIFMLLLKIGVVHFFGYDSHSIIERNEQSYLDYMSQYSGKISADTVAKIKEEYNAVNKAESAINSLMMKYEKGEISQEEYENQCIQYYDKQTRAGIFNLVYSKYVYAKEQVNERYILDSRGWETLLTHDTLDFILILCLITILTPIFCGEYENKMEVLLLSTRRGKYRSGYMKLFLSILLAIIITALFHLIQYFYLYEKVGLKHGGYPIQSLEFFQNSGYQISLMEAYLIVVALRILGAVLLACMVACISILTQKTIITLVVTGIFTILPGIIFQSNSTSYYLPFPTGLLRGTGYLWPSSYVNSFGEDGGLIQICTFKEIPSSHLKILLFILIVEILIIFFYSLKCYSYYFISWNSKRGCLKKKVGFFGSIVLCLIFTCGCGNKKTVSDKFYYNLEENANFGENAKYKVQVDYENNNIEVMEKNTEKAENLIREAFPDNMQILGIFLSGNDCYYLLELEENEEEVCIYCCDILNRSKSLVYSSVEENKEDFFGLFPKEYNASEMIMAEPTSGFFLNSKDIFLIKNSKVVQINRDTKEEKVIVDDLSVNGICYFNGRIFYVDQGYRLCEYDTFSREKRHLENIYTKNFMISENKIQYSNLLEGEQIQYYDLKD